MNPIDWILLAAVAAVALVLVLGVLSLFRPQINLAYAAHHGFRAATDSLYPV